MNSSSDNPFSAAGSAAFSASSVISSSSSSFRFPSDSLFLVKRAAVARHSATSTAESGSIVSSQLQQQQQQQQCMVPLLRDPAPGSFVCAVVTANQHLRVCCQRGSAASPSGKWSLVTSVDGRATGWVLDAALVCVFKAPSPSGSSHSSSLLSSFPSPSSSSTSTSSISCFLDSAVINEQHVAELTRAKSSGSVVFNSHSLSTVSTVMSPLKRKTSFRQQQQQQAAESLAGGSSSSVSASVFGLAEAGRQASGVASLADPIRTSNIEVMSALFSGPVKQLPPTQKDRPSAEKSGTKSSSNNAGGALLADTSDSFAAREPSSSDHAAADADGGKERLFHFKLKRSKSAATAANQAADDDDDDDDAAASPFSPTTLSMEVSPISDEERGHSFLSLAPLASTASDSQQETALPLTSNHDIRHLVVFSGSEASALGHGGSGFVLLGALRPPEDFVLPTAAAADDDQRRAVLTAQDELQQLRRRVRSNEETLQQTAASKNSLGLLDRWLAAAAASSSSASSAASSSSPSRARSLNVTSSASPLGATSTTTTTTTNLQKSFLERTGNSPLLGANIVAVKVVTLPTFSSSKFEHLRRETVIHAAASVHPNILPLFGVFPVYGGAGSNGGAAAGLNLHALSTVVPPLPPSSSASPPSCSQQPIAVAFVFPWCDGGALDSLLAARLPSPHPQQRQQQQQQRYSLVGPLREFELSAVCHGILSGLNFLHDTLGVADRDVKTSNVLLTSYGQVLLADLGIAKQVVRGKQQRQNGDGGGGEKQDRGEQHIRTISPPSRFAANNATLCGSPLFLAPEVFETMFPSSSSSSSSLQNQQQKQSSVDLRQADIFSLGVLLRTLLFENAAETLPEEVLRSEQMDEETESLLRRDISAETRQVISSMLRRDPSQRPTSATLLSEFPLLRKYAKFSSSSSSNGNISTVGQHKKAVIYPSVAALVGSAAIPLPLADEVNSLSECVSISPDRLRQQQQDFEASERQQKNPLGGVGVVADDGDDPFGNSLTSVSSSLQHTHLQIPPNAFVGGATRRGSGSAAAAAAAATGLDNISSTSPSPRQRPAEDAPAPTLAHHLHLPPPAARSVHFAPTSAHVMPHHDHQPAPAAAAAGAVRTTLLGNSQRESPMLQTLIAETLRQPPEQPAPIDVAVSAMEIANRNGTAVTHTVSAGDGSAAMATAGSSTPSSVQLGGTANSVSSTVAPSSTSNLPLHSRAHSVPQH